MHPAARVFLIAVVIVLVCSHLILSLMTDKPMVVTRQLTPDVVRQLSVEDVNDDDKTAASGHELIQDRIGDMKLESGEPGFGNVKVVAAEPDGEVGMEKQPVAVDVEEGTTLEQDENSDEGQGQDFDVDGGERKEEDVDCEGSDGDDSSN